MDYHFAICTITMATGYPLHHQKILTGCTSIIKELQKSLITVVMDLFFLINKNISEFYWHKKLCSSKTMNPELLDAIKDFEMTRYCKKSPRGEFYWRAILTKDFLFFQICCGVPVDIIYCIHVRYKWKCHVCLVCWGWLSKDNLRKTQKTICSRPSRWSIKKTTPLIQLKTISLVLGSTWIRC